ncbi:fluoride efflux transporter CrcB [Clostridium fermenticellae]|uniref:Fluoride-specific ion channel FluC n=1 Tax=Clostridium fermenticellae TaxID=2068654 RepID=A0A386H465_9CLOT|nr:fluoride efflux transporter CrcB [Clostridium fermenticellae]AYD40502.1 fluoride efflux transporter CrcB [Clostridium fermenticellae]
MNYLLVGAGGILGSITRYQLGKAISGHTNTKFPFGTFIINITGAIILGILTSAHLGTNMYSFLGDGFLGAYTTFSTFMYEGFNLFKYNEKLNALVYILISILLGITGFLIGLKIH